MSARIESVGAHRIWDSRGRPTIEVGVRLTDGAVGRGIAPAGASRGSLEALDLRDGGAKLGGLDVARAVANVNGPIAAAIAGLDARDQSGVDAAMLALDASPTKSMLGGNATIATSMAVLAAAAAQARLPLWRYVSEGREVRLPLPEIQIFGGGAHAGRRIDVQDLLVMPVGAQSFDEALVMVAEVYRVAGELMAESGRRNGVADEGGWWPDFASNEEAIAMLARVIDVAGYRHGEVLIALDIAASEFRVNERYAPGLAKREYDTGEWIDIVLGWVARYPIVSLEDPVAEDDTAGMIAITAAIGDRVQIIGDDYLVTNAPRIEAAAQQGACNAVLLKPNQVGTITETIAALRAAERLGWGTIVSARSGETEDTTIAHLAIGWNAGQLKVGSFARSERMVKWNECLRIERELGVDAVFAGRQAIRCLASGSSDASIPLTAARRS
ncbi:MAG: phosphopyruvate hydratase [Casimicrobiaceae bacterium]